VADNVFDLTVANVGHGFLAPSSRELAKRRLAASSLARRQSDWNTPVQENLLTLGGRVYMMNVTLGSQPYTLVIDSGSSDTWVAGNKFQCYAAGSSTASEDLSCGFGSRFNESSPTFIPIPGSSFGVNYTSTEFLRGRLGVETFGVGRVGLGESPLVSVRQTIGVVEEGYWDGDGISSGLMGLAYPALASDSDTLGYTSVVFTLMNSRQFSPVWSIALTRPSIGGPAAGGQLALGGIPNIAFGDWAQVPILRTRMRSYTFYTIGVDGFNITAPASTSSGIPTGPLDSLTTSSTPAMLDSGTTLIYLPEDVADTIATLFSPPAVFNSLSELYIVSCDADAPRVGIIVGGKSFFINVDDLMNRGPGAVGGPGVGAGPGECALAVQRAQGGPVLGDAFLRNVLAIFNLADNSVILAEREEY
jgi:hypothetical protein